MLCNRDIWLLVRGSQLSMSLSGSKGVPESHKMSKIESNSEPPGRLLSRQKCVQAWTPIISLYRTLSSNGPADHNCARVGGARPA